MSTIGRVSGMVRSWRRTGSWARWPGSLR